MDIQTAVIGGLTFAVCAGILLFISKFGMKEKSYEEALAEQRKRTTDLLGVQKNTKAKEKKTKKSVKKVKEKHPVTTASEIEIADESEESTDNGTSSATNIQHKPHVEFKEPTIIEEPSSVEESVPNILHKQKPGKKNKVRPILIHKPVENPVITDIIDVPIANHFEQLHPKDEFELLYMHLNTVKEETPKTDVVKEKSNVSKPKENEVTTKEKPSKARNNSSEGKENKDNKSKQAASSSKEKNNKEKQNDAVEETQKNKKQPKLETLPSSTSSEESVADVIPPATPLSNGPVLNVVKEKKKKKTDTANLLHLTGSKDADVNLTLLLNAVRKAELSRSEVQILIDLLLNKQHEAPETLDEWSEGKTDPVQKLKKQLVEKEKALVEEQEALIGAQAKLREVRSEQIAERAQLQQRNRGLEEVLQAKHLELQAVNSRLLSQNQKIQQMQAQLNEEAIILCTLREENTGLQLQRQQVDIHLSQAQEAEVTIQDLQSRNNQLAIELHSLTEQNMAAKDHHQNVIVQLQHQINHFKGELDEKENINHSLDDLCRDLEHRINMAHRIENELKHEVSQLKSVCQQHAEEVRRLEHGKGQTVEELRNVQKQKEELDHIVNQLQLELRDFQGENSELRMLRVKGVEQNEFNKTELAKLQNELSSTKSDIVNYQKQVSDLKKNHAGVIAEYNESLARLQTDLDEQKNKNNELRKKNWKVMDALKTAENKVLDISKQSPVTVDELSKVRSEEQQTNIKFIERLFPNMEISKSLPFDEWIQSAESYIGNYLKTLENSGIEAKESEIGKLQGQLQHYKAIIDDTEGILKKLQNHIEQEEILWRNEMKNKDLEIESIKKQYSSELTTKVQHLELQLNVEREAKQKLSEQYEQMKTSQSSAIAANSAIIEKLSEEVKQLNQQITVERSRSAELPHASAAVNDSNNKLENSSSSNGPLLEQDEPQ